MLTTVQTQFGPISGTKGSGRYEAIALFKGVPYAAPPVGELRWRDPVDPESWEGVRACDRYAPRPPQEKFGPAAGFEPYQTDFYYMGDPEMSEDCLYLNIATGAESADEKRPVFLWFHGGSLTGGYSYEIEFEPCELARKGIVVVSVGQRLNVFGYLALPQLSAEQGGISGNYGLKDEIKALDWVYRNISAFGGDPENITVGGQSGGTWKSSALATSPKQGGRVRRVINQSSLCWKMRYPSVKELEQEGVSYLKACGFDEDTPLEVLRAQPYSAFYIGLSPFSKDPHVPDHMCCDGVNVAFESAEKNMETYGMQCDWLCGINLGETGFHGQLVMGSKPEVFRTAEEVYEQARTFLGEDYPENFPELYPMDNTKAERDSRYLSGLGFSGMGNNLRDRVFGAMRAEKVPEKNTWSYFFTRVPPCRPEEKGTARDSDQILAWHSCELWYTFASLRENVPPARPWEETDFRVAELCSSYWANFMKTGDPNGEGLPEWPKSDSSYGWIEIGDQTEGHSGLTDLDRLLLQCPEKSWDETFQY